MNNSTLLFTWKNIVRQCQQTDNWICPTHPWKLCISLITKFRTKILILNKITYYMPTVIKKSRANLIPTVVMSKEFCCQVIPSISKTSVFWMSKGENLLERWQIMANLLKLLKRPTLADWWSLILILGH